MSKTGEEIKKKVAEKQIYAKEYHKKNSKKRFITLTHSLLTSEVYLSLKPNSKILYTYMRDYSNGNITTIFPRTLQEKLFTSSTFQTAREELKEKGFINFDDDKTRKEKGTYYDTEKKQLKPIVYTFSDKWQKYKVEKNKKRASNLQKHNEQKKNKGKTQIIQELKDNLQ